MISFSVANESVANANLSHLISKDWDFKREHFGTLLTPPNAVAIKIAEDYENAQSVFMHLAGLGFSHIELMVQSDSVLYS